MMTSSARNSTAPTPSARTLRFRSRRRPRSQHPIRGIGRQHDALTLTFQHKIRKSLICGSQQLPLMAARPCEASTLAVTARTPSA